MTALPRWYAAHGQHGLPWRQFVLFDDDVLAGMSCFINADAARGVVEIGNTYYRPKLRGTGFNRRAKD